jgi:hypothetical protein
LFSSTVLLDSSRTCNRPHHGIPPDRNQAGIIGVNLPAFLLSKSSYLDPVKASWKFEIRGLKLEDPKTQDKIKNPASSAGRNHHTLVALREARLFLACARKEPHYGIYFWPSLGLTLGRTFFDPTVMPLNARTTPEPEESILGFLDSSSPLKQLFGAATVKNRERLCKSARQGCLV